MKFGICARSDYKLIKEAGFDFAEVSLSEMALMSPEKFSEFKEEFKTLGLEVYSANLFLPGYLSVTDGTKSLDEIKEYALVAMERLHDIGGKIAVLGSSGQRKIPDDVPFEVGYQRFIDAIKIFCEVASQYGITVAVEPLDKDCTNLINTLDDALKLCEDVNLPNFGTIADTYHMYLNGEKLSDIKKVKKYLKHLHLARLNRDRKMPFEEKDIEDLKELKKILCEIGFDGGMSLECGMVPDFAEGSKEIRKTLKMFE